MKKMRLLITGGAGCLGSNIVEHYYPQGHEICVIDNFSTGKREVLPEKPGLHVVEGTISESGLVNKAFSDFQPTHVIHSAAAYKEPDNWAEDTLTNVLGTINIAKASLFHGVKRLVNFQTALCYGRPLTNPIPVDHPISPFTSYGISKVAGESFLIQSGLSVLSLRLSNICGPRLAIGPIPTFYKRLKAGHKCFCSDSVRDFLDMKDFIRFMDIALNVDAPSGIFNVSTGEGHSIYEVYKVVSDYLGIIQKDVPIVPIAADDIQSVVLDPTLTEQKFAWKAEVGFEETIRNQLQWYDRHSVTDVYSHLKQ